MIRGLLAILPLWALVGCANSSSSMSHDASVDARGDAPSDGGAPDGGLDAARDAAGCGAHGQPCCPPPLPGCEPTLVCSSSNACACAPGTHRCGSACIPMATCCTSADCNPPSALCVGGVCCGVVGLPCCSSGPACAPGSLCMGGSCVACGGLGQPCCSSGTACGAGSCLSGHCVDFAGGYQVDDVASSCAGACHVANPFTNTCSCPSGFAATCYRVIDDCAGGGTQSGSLACLCSPPGGFPGGSFGGAFERDDGVNCNVGCRIPNPYTGACSCPAGTGDVPLRTIVDTPCPGTLIGAVIVACVGSGPATTFGGVWQNDDGPACTSSCRTANPRTGGYSCASGFSRQAFRVEVDCGGFLGSLFSACVGTP